jgi:hypothetical protein
MKCLKAALLTLVLTWPASARAEVTGTPFVADLKTPTKIVMTRGGNLLVSEAGNPPATFLANHGRVSLVDRGGARRTLVDRLPAGLDLDDGGSLGPTGLWVADRYTLYVAIGIGDVTKRNAARGEVPNPAGLSSALFSSLWRIRFSEEIDDLVDGFALDPATHYGELADGREIRLVNASGARARIRVLADFRDLYPGTPPNPVSASNPFGLLLLEGRFYLPDAGQNALVSVDGETGRIETLVHFPPVRNTSFPAIGPPMSQPVPNGIRKLSDGSALVTLLSGFPFGPGAASVQKVDVSERTTTAFISGLTMAIDVLPLGHAKGPFLVLEYASRFVPPGPGGPGGFMPPGRLLRFADRTSAPEVLSSALVSPTSMAFDDCTGELFVAEIQTGKIIRFELQ